MNKLLTKIVGLSLGLSMAIGVGVAVTVSASIANSVNATAVGGTDTIDNSNLDLSATANTSWKNGSFSNTTSGAVYGYRLMGTKGTSDDRVGGTNANGGIWTTSSGGTLSSVTVTTTTAKALALYGGTAAFSAYNDTDGRTSLGSKTTSGSGSTYTATWSNLSTNGCTHVLLKGTASSTFIKSFSFVWLAPSSDPTITLGSNELYVATTTQKTLSVDYSHLTANISVTQSGSGSVTLSTDGENYSSSLTLNKDTSAPQTLYVKGNAQGTATLSFASTNATTQTCTVHVDTPTIYKKISSTAEMKNGGSYALVATGTSIAMSKTQLSNGRDPVNIDFVDGDIHLPASHNVALLTISNGSGDFAGYHTIFDPAYSTQGGYLEYYNSNLTCYYVSSTPTTNAYYWAIAFNGSGNVVLENKANAGNYLEYNASASGKVFRLYAGTQTKLDLYELSSDIPQTTYLTSITAANVSIGAGSTITYSGTYAPTNATVSISANLGSAIATLGAVTMDNGTFSVSITAGENAGSTTLTLSGASGVSTTTSATPTLTVTSYTATHSKVTSSSGLSNGAKIIFGSPSSNANTNYSSGAHTGGNYVPVVSTAYSEDKTTLSAALTSKEYTVWCVDSEHGYYVFSDGGYFLCAPSSANNYLQRSDTLNERCYFYINSDSSSVNEGGVIVQSYYAEEQHWQHSSSDIDYTVQYNYNNGTGPRFALYRVSDQETSAPSQTAATLYLSNSALNQVQGFVDAWMHFGNVSESVETDTNACRSEGSGAKNYWADASAAYETLSAAQQLDFVQNYEDAALRLSYWAEANGAELDLATGALSAKVAPSIFGTVMSDSTATTVIVIISVISVSAIGGFFFLRKRKEQ